MITKIEETRFFTRVEFLFEIGDHTTSGRFGPMIFKENAIMTLRKEIKEMAREKGIEIHRVTRMQEFRELNEELNRYIENQRAFLNKMMRIPYVNESQVTVEQLKEVCAIGDQFGRHGSKSVLDYRKLKDKLESLQRFWVMVVMEHENSELEIWM